MDLFVRDHILIGTSPYILFHSEHMSIFHLGIHLTSLHKWGVESKFRGRHKSHSRLTLHWTISCRRTYINHCQTLQILMLENIVDCVE